MKKLQDTHEAYQVLIKVMKAKNRFIKKAEEKKEKNIKAAENVAVLANVFMKKGLGRKSVSFI